MDPNRVTVDEQLQDDHVQTFAAPVPDRIKRQKMVGFGRPDARADGKEQQQLLLTRR